MVEGGLLQEAVAEDAEVIGGEEELVLEIRDHASELAVDEVPSTDEIRGRDAHKSEDHLFLRFATSTGFDLRVEYSDEFAVSGIGEVKICDYRFAIDA
jgi:hypothetical protein